MSKFAAKHAGLSSDLIGAMMHVLRAAEKQLSSSRVSASDKKKNVTSKDLKKSSSRIKRSVYPSPDKSNKRPCVKSHSGKRGSVKKDSPREPTSLKRREAPKVTPAEKKAVRQALSKEPGSRKDTWKGHPRDNPANYHVVLNKPAKDDIWAKHNAEVDRKAETAKLVADRVKDNRASRRRRLQNQFRMTERFLAQDKERSEEDILRVTKSLERERVNSKKRPNASLYCIVIPVTECGLLKRGGSVYCHYTWTVDSKGLPLKVKRDYGKATKDLDIQKLEVKNSRVHFESVAAAKRRKVRKSRSAVRARVHAEKHVDSLKAKAEVALSEDAVEKVIAKARGSVQARVKGLDTSLLDESDTRRVISGVIRKGFAYGTRTLLRAAKRRERDTLTLSESLAAEKAAILEKLNERFVQDQMTRSGTGVNSPFIRDRIRAYNPGFEPESSNTLAAQRSFSGAVDKSRIPKR